MAETLLEKDALAAGDAIPASDWVWVQRGAGTGAADRRMSLSAVKDLIEGLIGPAEVATAGLVKRNTVDGAGVTHFVAGIAADGALVYAVPPGTGDVGGPLESVAGNIATYGDDTGKVIVDSGIDVTGVLRGVNNLSDVVNVETAKANLSLSKADVGLALVDNTADADKPLSTAATAALLLKVSTSEVGAAGGVATLDGTGRLPEAQLPTSVATDIATAKQEAIDDALALIIALG